MGNDGVDLDTCCLKWNCTDPFTLGTPPVGYVSDSSVENSFTSTNNVVGISCDSANGYYQLPGGITATCGDDTQGGGVPSFTLGGCDQGCVQPTDITGYTNLPDVLPPSSGPVVMPSPAACANNYHGTPTYNCATAGEGYTLDGCDADVCTLPVFFDYAVHETSLERHDFSVDVECADGYGSSTTAVAQAQVCDSNGEPYSLTGCENKTGFCSGNYDSSNDVLCPTGYNDKPDKNTIVGDTLDTCCDHWICRISDDDFASYDIQVAGQSINRNHISYNTIDSATVSCKAGAQGTSGSVIPSIQSCSNDGDNVTLNGCEHAPVDCVVDWSEWSYCSAECGEGIQLRTYNTVTTQPAHGGTPCPTTPDRRSCNIEACASETQDTELPICSQVAVPNKIAESDSYEVPADNLQDCSDLCAILPTCQSFAYSDIDTSRDRRFLPTTNCIISESSGTIDPYGGFNNEGYISWSFYPKCRVS